MKKISIGTLDIDDKEISAVVDVMKSGKISAGEKIEEFESLIAKRHGKKHGIFVNSGQSALEVAIVLAKLKFDKPKLNVLVPATTYAASIWPILNNGCDVNFCDIDWNFVIDYKKARHDFDICLPVDLCGYPSYKFGDFFTVEDACEAVGNEYCTYGDIVCVSFYVSHIITTGCGGMLCLDDDYLAGYARSYIAHGRKYGGDYTKFLDKWVDRFLFDKVGQSYRGTAIEASIGIEQYKKLDSILKKRRENAQYLFNLYNEFHNNAYDIVEFPKQEYIDKCSFQFFPVLVRDHIDREDFLQYLFKNGIDSRVLLSLTNQPIIKDLYGDIENDYPVAKYCNKKGFIIGCHQELNKDDLNRIIKVIGSY